MGRKAAKAKGPPGAISGLQWEGVDLPFDPPQNEGRLVASERGNFSLPCLQELPASCSAGLTGGQRRRFFRDVNEACRALYWMHGEETRPRDLPPSLDKNQCLRADLQQRVILAALRWVDADNVVDENEPLANLLKGSTSYALGVSSNVGSNEYSRVSIPD